MKHLIRRSLAILMLAFVAIVSFSPLSPGIAYADDAAPVVTEDSSQFVISPVLWSIIVGVFLPFVVALLTKLSANERVKAVVGVIIAALGAIVTRATLVDGSAVFTQALALDIFLVYAPQLLSYLGLWSKFQINARVAPRFGLG